MKKLLFVLLCSISLHAFAEQFEVKGTSRDFNPEVIFIKSGDSIIFTNMISNNTVSVQGLIPENAEPWNSRIGLDKEITFNEDGVYTYISVHGIQYGVSGLIVVGEPTNLDQAIQFAENNMRGPYKVLTEKLKKLKQEIN